MTDIDRSTMFVICGIMIDLERYTNEKRLVDAARCIANYRRVVAANPGFLKRFEGHQDAVLKDFEAQVKGK